jgi:hypothetical protein
MKIRYDGPGSFVNVHPYGQHLREETKEYPDDFGEELIATSKAQKFTVVGDRPFSQKGEPTLDDPLSKRRDKGSPKKEATSPKSPAGEPPVEE